MWYHLPILLNVHKLSKSNSMCKFGCLCWLNSYTQKERLAKCECQIILPCGVECGCVEDVRASLCAQLCRMSATTRGGRETSSHQSTLLYLPQFWALLVATLIGVFIGLNSKWSHGVTQGNDFFVPNWTEIQLQQKHFWRSSMRKSTADKSGEFFEPFFWKPWHFTFNHKIPASLMHFGDDSMDKDHNSRFAHGRVMITCELGKGRSGHQLKDVATTVRAYMRKRATCIVSYKVGALKWIFM